MPHSISIIVAINRDNAIGKENQLLYHLPNDLKHFKELTTGHTIIMGRRTFESLPKGALPNRRNIVLSKQKDLVFPGAKRYSSLKTALKYCGNNEKVYIIGGASVYKNALPIANELCLTVIDDAGKAADVYFPHIDFDEWEETYRQSYPADEKHLYPYQFINYVRKRNT